MRVVGLGLLVLALGCASTSDGASEGGTVRIVATTDILGDLTRAVVGDLAEVEVLVPSGTDPHTFEPSAQQVAALREADVVVANGLGLEANLVDVLAAAAEDGTTVVEMGPQLSPLPAGATVGGITLPEGPVDPGRPPGLDGAEGRPDPHVWMDPDRMGAAATLVAEQVSSATGLDGSVMAANAADYDAALRAADEQVQAAFADVPPERRVVVTDHDRLGYFAPRYGLEVVGTVVPATTTGAEPSAEHLAELAEVVRQRQVPAIFVESTGDDDLADALGTDARVVVLPTGWLGAPGSGTDTLPGLLVTTAERMASALVP